LSRENDLKEIVNSLKCLIVFENKTWLLYQNLAERIDSALIKSLLLHISLDSQKHSTVLKGIAINMPKTNWTPADLPKKMGETWRSMDDFQVELSDVEIIPEEALVELLDQLTSLETQLAEEYDLLVQINTLELFSEQLSKIYRINLETLKIILLEIMHDEEYHKEILNIIANALEKDKVIEFVDNTPKVRFRNPDGWNRPQQITV
jgi:hypothetical protein